MLYGVLEEKLYRALSTVGDFVFGTDSKSIQGTIKREEKLVIDFIVNLVLKNNEASLIEGKKNNQRDVKVIRRNAYEDADRHTDVFIAEPFPFLVLLQEPTSSLRYELKSVGIRKKTGLYFCIDAYGVWKPNSIEETIFNDVYRFLLEHGYVKYERRGSYGKMLPGTRS